MNNDNAGSEAKKPTPARAPRRTKQDDRLDKIEETMKGLIKVIEQTITKSENTNNEIETKSASKRKSEEPSIDLPSTSTSNMASENGVPKQKQSKIEIVCDVAPEDVLLSRTDRRSSETDFDSSFRVVNVPKFDGKSKNLTLQVWLAHLESVAFNDEMLIVIMKKNLDGEMLKWLDRQKNTNISWEGWKKLLYDKWHCMINQERVDQLQEFTSTNRRQNEDIIDFYYSKKRHGEYFGLNDNLICNIIIHRLHDPHLAEEAHRVGCKDTRSLLIFLKEYLGENTDRDRDLGQTCGKCGRRGHKSSECYGICKHCNKTGHRPEYCKYKPKSMFV